MLLYLKTNGISGKFALFYELLSLALNFFYVLSHLNWGGLRENPEQTFIYEH